jgi:hypothetical protein
VKIPVFLFGWFKLAVQPAVQPAAQAARQLLCVTLAVPKVLLTLDRVDLDLSRGPQVHFR